MRIGKIAKKPRQRRGSRAKENRPSHSILSLADALFETLPRKQLRNIDGVVSGISEHYPKLSSDELRQAVYLALEWKELFRLNRFEM